MGNFLQVSCYICFLQSGELHFFFISSRIPHFAGFEAFPILQDSINLFEQISCKMGNCYTRLKIVFPILQDFNKIPQFEGFNCSDFFSQKVPNSYKMGNFLKMDYYDWFPTKQGTTFFLFHQEFPTLLDFKHSLFCRILKIWFGQISCKIGNCYTRLNIVFPRLKDFKKIPQFEGLVILSKATKWGIFQSLSKYHNFKFRKFPILQDLTKIPQFEGLVITSKATKWGIFQRLFKYHRFKFPILQDFMKIPQFEGSVISSKATKWGIFQELLKEEKDPISLNNSKRTLNDQTQIGKLKSYA